jgi:vitamin B12/bleomycin/antimicrobial peptide transport system ATP-binding/permease protein
MIDRFLTRITNAHSFLAKLWVLARPYWFTQERSTIRFGGLVFTVKEAWIGRGVLALIIGLSVFLVYLSKLINSWYARFYNALQEKNADVFWVELKVFAVLATLFIITSVYRIWLTQLLSIRWRRWLSEVYFRDWLADRTYYHMELTRQGADNPEQRIEQDCFNFTKQTLNHTLELLLQVMTLATFAVVLWNLSSDFVLPVFGGLAVPGFMMWVALVYALIGSLATYFVGRPLVRVNFMLERYNADFRYRMIRIRENAESIALYRGERDEGRGLEAAFARVYGIWWDNMKYTKRLSWLTYGYRQAVIVLPIVLAAPQYFAGLIAFGVLQQTLDAFDQVQKALSWFVEFYKELAEWKAVVDRLTGFSEAMVAAKEAAAETAFIASPSQPRQLTVEGVEVRLPDGELLLEHVDLTVTQGESVALAGPSGSGKTTIFRVLAGLWPFGRGRVALPKDARILFLPQKPYLPIGTLREALSYPEMPERYSDEACREVLEACAMGHLAPRLDETANWSLVLSGGEQQRLAFARALLYRPDWLFLDEASSALDAATEGRMYALLRERLPGAAVISVAHRPEVVALHRRQLVIDPISHRVTSGTATAR